MAKDTPLAVQEEGNAVAFAALHQPRAPGTCAGGMRPQATLYIFVYSKIDSDLSCSIPGIKHSQMSPTACVSAGLRV